MTRRYRRARMGFRARARNIRTRPANLTCGGGLSQCPSDGSTQDAKSWMSRRMSFQCAENHVWIWQPDSRGQATNRRSDTSTPPPQTLRIRSLLKGFPSTPFVFASR